jgi:catechol 2,3-dioxygenase-like lactoylglutathione lyase family enzyme
MAQVTGIGGIFIKAQDPAGLREWYRTRLGVDVQSWGGAQFLFNRRDRPGIGYTVWTPFEAVTKYFAPSDKPFMVNLRVDDLEAMLAQLRERGARVLDRRDDGPNGKFGYVLDPEGTLLELWEQSGDDPYVPAE